MMTLLTGAKEVMKKGFAQQWEVHATIASFGPLEHGKSYMIVNACMLALRVQSQIGGHVIYIIIKEKRTTNLILGLDSHGGCTRG
jgi:hypothetical protein